MVRTRFPGIAVRLADGEQYVIPRLPYPIRADLEKRHAQTIALLQAGKPAPDELGFTQDAVFAALKLNYPEMTADRSSQLIEGELQNGAVRLVIAGLCRGVVSLGCAHQRSN